MDIQKTFPEIRAAFEKTRPAKLNAMILGRYGTGKTNLALSGVRPIALDLFDPGGLELRTARAAIKEGWLLPTDFSGKSPQEFGNWHKSLERRANEGFFDHIGTYIIDSGTLWVRSHLVSLMGSAEKPSLQHYQVAGFNLAYYLKSIMEFPCDFIMTGHIVITKDEASGSMETAFDVFESQKEGIPRLFGEVWATRIVKTSKGPQYELLVSGDGKYAAETKIGGFGLFDSLREPNKAGLVIDHTKRTIVELKKKAGLPCEDKPY